MKCERCEKEANVSVMSMFNLQAICMACKDVEKTRHDYSEAVAADEAAIRRGNYHFKGIGLRDCICTETVIGKDTCPVHGRIA